MSLYELINTKTEFVKPIDSRQYTWYRQYSGDDVRRLHADREFESVRLTHIDDLDVGYGNSITGVNEAWLYPDGNLLVCTVQSEFVGTFHSNNENEVMYYYLVPNPEWEKRRTGCRWKEEYDVISYYPLPSEK